MYADRTKGENAMKKPKRPSPYEIIILIIQLIAAIAAVISIFKD